MPLSRSQLKPEEMDQAGPQQEVEEADSTVGDLGELDRPRMFDLSIFGDLATPLSLPVDPDSEERASSTSEEESPLILGKMEGFGTVKELEETLSYPSRANSMLSDPRSSVASTASSFTHYSAASSRLSTTSSRLSATSFGSSRDPRLPATSSRLYAFPRYRIEPPSWYFCTFCKRSLKSKRWWKCHEEEFHEQRLTWRCPNCEQMFYAGKRFREHHAELHVCFPVLSSCNYAKKVRVVSTAIIQWHPGSRLTGKRRHVRRSMRGLCMIRMRGAVASVAVC